MFRLNSKELKRYPNVNDIDQPLDLDLVQLVVKP